MRPRWRVVVPALLVLAAGPLSGRGWGTPWRDAASLGRGGTTTAAPEAGAAFVTNPALALGPRAHRLRLLAGLTLDTRAPSTHPRDAEAPVPSPPEVRTLPLLAAWGPLGIARLGAGAWVRVSRDERAWFPGQEAASPLLPSAGDLQRYGALRYRFFTLHYGVAVAWQPAPWFALGVAFAGRWIQISHARVLYLGSAAAAISPGEATRYDAALHLSLSDPFVPEGRAGLFLRPVGPLRIGLTAGGAGPARLTGEATLGSVAGSQVALLSRQGGASLSFTPSWWVRAAVGVDARWLSLDAEAAVLGATRPRAPTAKVSGLLVRLPDALAVTEIGAVPLEAPTRRRVRLSVGAEFRVPGTGLRLCAGYHFRQGAVDAAWHSAARVDPDAHLFAVGVQVARGPLELSVAYARNWAAWRGAPGNLQGIPPSDPAAVRPIGARAQTRHGDLVAVTLTVALTSSE